MPRGRPKSNTGENVMTDEVKKEQLPHYHTVVASIDKMDVGNPYAGTVSRSTLERRLDTYYERGYRLFTAYPVRDAGDSVTVMYVLQLKDND